MQTVIKDYPRPGFLIGVAMRCYAVFAAVRAININIKMYIFDHINMYNLLIL